MALNLDVMENMDDPHVRQAVENLLYLKSRGWKVNKVLCLIKCSENEVLRKRVHDNLIQLLIDVNKGTPSTVETQLIKDLFPLMLKNGENDFVREWPVVFCKDIHQILIMIEKKRKIKDPISSLCQDVLDHLDIAMQGVLEEEKVNKLSEL